MNNFTLSLDNFKAIPFDKYENNFTFIVNGKKYETKRIIADLLSPIVSKFHFQDETIDEFSINVDINEQEKNSQNDYFRDFLNLFQFNQVKLDSSRQKYYLEYFRLLGNGSEFIRLQKTFLQDITIENVVDRLLFIQEMSNSFENIQEVNTVINFAAQHFEHIDRNKLKNLNLDFLEEIFQSELLKLEEEETLLQFITDLYMNDKMYSCLFEYVIFTNLKDENFESFISSFDINDLNESIWKSICTRILSSKINQERKTPKIDLKRYHKKSIPFQYQKGEEFNGIIQFLTEKTGGNIHDNGTITISSNSIYGSNNLPQFVVDFLKDNSYYSTDDGNAKVCFDFKKMKIQLSNYSIKSGNNGKGGSHLKNWIIEGSNDGENWDMLDYRRNDSSLDGPLMISTFDVSKDQTNFYRFIQLRQTGNSWYKFDNHFTICFRMIEFFGKLLI